MLIEIDNINSLPQAAEKFISAMNGRKIFLFNGSMGAGKTTLIAEICRQLGVADGEVCSPTFAIVNEYEAKDGPIYHFDLYRLESPSEVADMGGEEYFNSGDVCFVEWPEIGREFLPDSAVDVEIREDENGARIIEIPD